MSIGTKLTTDGKLASYIVVEQYLGKTNTTSHTVSVKFEVILEDDDGTVSDLDQFAEKVERALVIVAVAAVAVVVGVAIAEVLLSGTAVSSFFLMLGGWMSTLFA